LVVGVMRGAVGGVDRGGPALCRRARVRRMVERGLPGFAAAMREASNA
jgi:hypothetical protein